MTYTLVIGDRGYSSWSLRGWLLFDAFGIPVTTLRARLYTDELPDLLKRFPPARTVPTMRTPAGSRPSSTPAAIEAMIAASGPAFASRSAIRGPRPARRSSA